jgi:hypothetical protein
VDEVANKIIQNTKTKKTKIELDKLYEGEYLFKAEHQVPLLRYIYGLPLCEENERIDAVTLVGVCEAALDFGMMSLHELGLRELKELLVGLLQYLEVDGRGHISGDFEPFVKVLRDLFEPEVSNLSDGLELPVVDLVVEVCCTYFTHFAYSKDFEGFWEQQPMLLLAMLRYAACRGPRDNILNRDPRKGI